MRNWRGNASNLTIVSKFFNSLSSLYHPYEPNVSDFPFSMRLRLFSTMGGNPVRGQFKSSSFDEFNDHNSDDNDTFSGKNRRNFTAQQNPNFRRQNPSLDRSFRRKGRDFNGQFVGGRNRANMRSNDNFFNFNGNDERRGNVGLGGHVEGKKNSTPSISELLNRSLKGDEEGGKEGGDLLEKFKLDEDKKEDQSDESMHAIKSQEEKMGPTEDAEVIFKKMKQSGLIPNAVAMLDGLCRDGLVQEAMELFEVMREKHTMPEVVVYTAVVEGFCQAQKLDDAKRVFKKMQGKGIAPNAFSYAVLIKGLCRGKRLEDAVDICVEMLEAGHLPNVTTFTALVHEFCEEKSVEEAQSMIDKLKQTGFYLDEKAVRNHLDKTGPTSPLLSQAIFGPKKARQRAI